MTPHLNHLVETVQMMGHNICFYAELTKIIRNYHLILFIWSSGRSHFGRASSSREINKISKSYFLYPLPSPSQGGGGGQKNEVVAILFMALFIALSSCHCEEE